MAGLAYEFAPHRLSDTIHDLAAAQHRDTAREIDHAEITSKIAECDHKLAKYRAALDAGASPATVAVWIAETEAERARREIGLRKVPTALRRRMTETEIRSIVERLADIARVLGDADPDDKSDGTLAWHACYATLRNTIEGLNGYAKDPARVSARLRRWR